LSGDFWRIVWVFLYLYLFSSLLEFLFALSFRCHFLSESQAGFECVSQAEQQFIKTEVVKGLADPSGDIRRTAGEDEG
jgi:hypothetical protein